MICYSVSPCALGHLLVAWSDKGVCAVEIGDSCEQLIRPLQARFPEQFITRVPSSDSPYFSRIIRLLDSPTETPPAMPLDIEGTPFQQQVWRALTNIPPGQTLSYAQLAQAIGRPNAVRAVASACGANPVAILIPCHRIVRSDGSLGGYRWGLARKRTLLQQEMKSAHP